MHRQNADTSYTSPSFERRLNIITAIAAGALLAIGLLYGWSL